MILSQETLDKRLGSEANITNDLASDAPKVQVIKWAGHKGGRTLDATLSIEQKLELGALTDQHGPKIASEIMGVSEPTAVNNSERGREPSIDEKASLLAAERLLTTLEFLTPDKLMNASAKDASSIAANLSKVALNMKGNRVGGQQGPQVLIVLNQPKPAKESHFEEIEVNS